MLHKVAAPPENNLQENWWAYANCFRFRMRDVIGWHDCNNKTLPVCYDDASLCRFFKIVQVFANFCEFLQITK